MCGNYFLFQYLPVINDFCISEKKPTLLFHFFRVILYWMYMIVDIAKTSHVHRNSYLPLRTEISDQYPSIFDNQTSHYLSSRSCKYVLFEIFTDFHFYLKKIDFVVQLLSSKMGTASAGLNQKINFIFFICRNFFFGIHCTSDSRTLTGIQRH